MARNIRVHLLPTQFSICRLEPDEPIPSWATGAPLFAVVRTEEELSLLCPTDQVPPGVHAVHRWRAFKVEGPLPFEEVGILLALAEPLASVGVSIFAVSTYDTDYVLVREGDLQRAVNALRATGIQIDDNTVKGFV